MNAFVDHYQRPVSLSRSLRISVVTETYPPEINGVAITTAHLVQRLTAYGHRVQLIRPRQLQDTPTSTVAVATDIETIISPRLPLPFYHGLQLGLPLGKALDKRWCQLPPDIVHIVTEGPLGQSALSCAKRQGIPVLSGFHTNFHSYSRYYGLGLLHTPIIAYLRHFHNRCAKTLVPTQELQQELSDYGFHNVDILPRGVDTQLFHPDRRSHHLRHTWDCGPDDPVVLYVGRLAAEKNLHLAIDTFVTIRRRHPQARFVLVGDGPLGSALREQYPEFIFCGVKRGEELAAHYASADIFLFPSLTETFGNVTLEAMASRLVVVAFDYAAARQHLRHDHDGLCLPRSQPKAFITAATALANNPERIGQLRHHARLTAEALDWRQISSQLETLFYSHAQVSCHD